jgi:hypothetical protein
MLDIKKELKGDQELRSEKERHAPWENLKFLIHLIGH